MISQLKVLKLIANKVLKLNSIYIQTIIYIANNLAIIFIVIYFPNTMKQAKKKYCILSGLPQNELKLKEKHLNIRLIILQSIFASNNICLKDKIGLLLAFNPFFKLNSPSSVPYTVNYPLLGLR